MNKILFLLTACGALGGCMATVVPAEDIQTTYLLPQTEIIAPAPVQYVHAVAPRVHHHRPVFINPGHHRGLHPVKPHRPGTVKPGQPGHVRPGHPGNVRPGNGTRPGTQNPGRIGTGRPGTARPGNTGGQRPGANRPGGGGRPGSGGSAVRK